MSVNITINTTIELPLSLVAAIQAADDGGIDEGMEDVSAAMNAAAVDAVKALPYRVHPSLPIVIKDEPPVASGRVRKCCLGLMTIIAKRLNGREHKFFMSPDDNIKKLKEILRELSGICIYDQRLVWQGRQLEDERTVSEYNLVDGVTLTLIMSFRGS